METLTYDVQCGEVERARMLLRVGSSLVRVSLIRPIRAPIKATMTLSAMTVCCGNLED